MAHGPKQIRGESVSTRHTVDELQAWTCAYRQFVAVPKFFEDYFALIKKAGQSPAQSFLVGSGLLREDEVSWCRALRWLLDGETGEGALKFQRAVVRRMRASAAKCQLVVEREIADDEGNRLDIVLSNATNYCVIEAKVNAAIDTSQLTRYRESKEVAGRKFNGMLLTKQSPPQLPAPWQHATWLDLADDLSQVVGDAPSDNSGEVALWFHVARDFINFIFQSSET